MLWEGEVPSKVMVFKVKDKDSLVLWFPLYYTNGIRTSGIYRDGIRYCVWCETQPLSELGQEEGGRINHSGYCNASPDRKILGARCATVRNRYLIIFDPRYHTYRFSTSQKKCKNCGADIRKANVTGYCSKRLECRRMGEKVHRESQRQRDSQENPSRACKNKECGRKLLRTNTTGYCSRRLECQRAYRESQKDPTLVCKHCGKYLNCNNATGYCKSPKRLECRRAYRDSLRQAVQQP